MGELSFACEERESLGTFLRKAWKTTRDHRVSLGRMHHTTPHQDKINK